VACVVDVGLLPCGRSDLLPRPRLDAGDVGLAPFGGVRPGLGVVLNVAGELAQRGGLLGVLEVGSEFERFRSDCQPGREVLVVACLVLFLFAIASPAVLLSERGLHHGGVGAALVDVDVVAIAQLLPMRLSASRPAWSSSRNVTAVS